MGKYRLTDGYKIPGYRPYQVIVGYQDDPQARVIRMKRVQKKRYAQYAEQNTGGSTTKNSSFSVIFPAVIS